MKNKKYFMHTPLNMSAILVVFAMAAVAWYFMWVGTSDDIVGRVLGIVLISLFLIAILIIDIKLFRTFDWVVFGDSTIERHTIFGKTVVYEYSEVFVGVGKYTSVIERKDYLVFSPKKCNQIVLHIDTSKYGNVIAANRLKYIYCPLRKELIEFLKTHKELQWYNQPINN